MNYIFIVIFHYNNNYIIILQMLKLFSTFMFYVTYGVSFDTNIYDSDKIE